MGYQKIEKCFITGVLPVSMADVTSGFNIAMNVSDESNLAGLCGLSYGDVCSALKLCCSNTNGDVEKHFRIMMHHYNGYCFSPYGAAQSVFNTNTCLEYLQVSDECFNIIEFLVIITVFLLHFLVLDVLEFAR